LAGLHPTTKRRPADNIISLSLIPSVCQGRTPAFSQSFFPKVTVFSPYGKIKMLNILKMNRPARLLEHTWPYLLSKPRFSTYPAQWFFLAACLKGGTADETKE